MEDVVKAEKKAFAFNPATRLHKFLDPTVWHHFTPLCLENKSINLGQGFPGWTPPDFVKEAGAAAIFEKDGLNYLANQYARSAGNLMLVEKLGKIYSERLGRKIDHINEIVVTNGATGAVFNITQGLLNPGDEVVVFEPAFDIYIAQAQMCHAVVRTVPMYVKTDEKTGAKYWTYDMDTFKKAFSSKTRLFILNTPHNPTGKVFTRSELEVIAGVLQEWPNCVCLSDEVYEHLCYTPHHHISIASLPNMWERTITVSSAGKTFSATGWKVGWVVGPAHITRCIGIVESWVCFSVNTPSQIAMSRALERATQPFAEASSYYTHLANAYDEKKKYMMKALKEVGFDPVEPEGSFFIMVDTSRIEVPKEWSEKYAHESRDWVLARWLTVDIGVACIPPSAFYQDENKHMAANLIRFAFCQSDDTLKEAVKRLEKVKLYLKA